MINNKIYFSVFFLSNDKTKWTSDTYLYMNKLMKKLLLKPKFNEIYKRYFV